jgi:hypothetical protein
VYTSIGSFDLVVHIPVLPHTFVDADLPFGFIAANQFMGFSGGPVGGAAALGNPMVGMHHVFRPVDRFWIHLGGALGAPLARIAGSDALALAQGLWDVHHFATADMPFSARLALEGHAGVFEFRADLNPVWAVSLEAPPSMTSPFAQPPTTTGHLFAFQHAVEVQAGHAIGGGLRYQGVLIATNNDSLNTSPPNGDHYQGCFELFFRLFHDPVFFRAGILMPVDPPLGPAFHASSPPPPTNPAMINNPTTSSWGARATMGYNLD